MTESICEECEKKFMRYGGMCFDLLEKICEAHLDKSLVVMSPSEDRLCKVLQFLESKGVVVSVDSDTFIVVRLAHGYDDDKKIFCWCSKDK